MGIDNDWSVWYVPEWICQYWKIKPGEYLVRYNSSTGDLVLKFPDKKVAERRINIYSDLALDKLNDEQLEAISRLQGKKYKSLGGGYCNHHIIPHDLCKKHPLVREAERYGVFKKDGDENLMPLPYDFHRKNHTENSAYYKTIQDFLDAQWASIVKESLDEDPYEIQQALLEIVEITREKLTELMQFPGSTIRDFDAEPNYSNDLLPG